MSVNLHKLYGETKKKTKKEVKHAELHAYMIKH